MEVVIVRFLRSGFVALGAGSVFRRCQVGCEYSNPLKHWSLGLVFVCYLSLQLCLCGRLALRMRLIQLRKRSSLLLRLKVTRID